MRVDYFREFYAPGINNIVAPRGSYNDFKAWVSSGRYQLHSAEENRFSLRISDSYAFSQMLAHDASRFASASFETIKILTFPQTLPKSLGWVIVEIYYAAFFSAHSIFRIFGNSFSFLQRGHLGILKEFSMASGGQWVMSNKSGSFLGLYDSREQELNVSKAGNSHEDFWKQFYFFLNTLRESISHVKGLDSVKQGITLGISDIMNGLSKDGKFSGGAWLPHVRNNVNYQHTDGLWYPYTGSAHDTDKLKRMLELWNTDEFNNLAKIPCKADIEVFLKACLMVVNFCFRLCNDVDKVSKERRNCFKMIPGAVIKIAI
ncbi:hypothetical protein LG302_12685 [Halomonas organivorans]